MKSFKDLNVSYKPADGKKRFPGSVVSIRELVNLPIIVKDFELGIKTEQGEDRCIVSIEQNGEAPVSQAQVRQGAPGEGLQASGRLFIHHLHDHPQCVGEEP